MIIALQAIGFGLFVAAFATKYRDLALLLGFAIQLLMFTAPVVYPLSSIQGGYKWIVMANPMTFAIESFRLCFFGKGTLPSFGFMYLITSTILIFALGVLSFNRAEKTFIDTV
jgi:lipopolysaccharide transport system permease protein